MEARHDDRSFRIDAFTFLDDHGEFQLVAGVDAVPDREAVDLRVLRDRADKSCEQDVI